MNSADEPDLFFTANYVSKNESETIGYHSGSSIRIHELLVSPGTSRCQDRSLF